MNKEVEFYIIRDKYTNYYAKAIELGSDAIIEKCSKCGSIYAKNVSALNVYFSGKRAKDYYKVSPYTIINEKFQQVLNEAGITGFILKDIIVEGWYDSREKTLDRNIDEFKEMEVIGRCGFLRDENGSIIEKCSECNFTNYESKKKSNGLSVNLDEWDKSDIFEFENWPGVTIVIEKVKQILEKNELKNFEFINIKDFKFSRYI